MNLGESALFLIFTVLLLGVGVGFIVFGLQFLWSAFYGAPYVSIKNSNVDMIIDALRRDLMGKRIVELGCGDGRLVRSVVTHTSATGVGVDVNLLVVWLARMRSRAIAKKKLSFVRASLLDLDLSSYDVFYMYLLPPLLVKATNKIMQERAGKKTLIISHAFLIHKLKKHLYKTIETTPYKTYVYKH